MSDFDHILDWKLLACSHTFPRVDGGAFINEGCSETVRDGGDHARPDPGAATK
ncbi:hypothetical protein [Bradyrhizobium sp. P5_C11_2]